MLTDVGIVFNINGMGHPLIIPVSDRAKAQFVRLGMGPDMDGVVATFSPLDMLDMFPIDWVMEIISYDPDTMLNFQEITLPDVPPVVH